MDGPNGQHDITWHSQLERILSDEGERCLCFQWLHSKSEARYTKLNTYLSIFMFLKVRKMKLKNKKDSNKNIFEIISV